MRTLIGLTLMVVIATLVSWGLVPSKVQAMASPCVQYEALGAEAERLREELPELQRRRDEAVDASNTAYSAYCERYRELHLEILPAPSDGYWNYLTPEQLLADAESYRARGEEALAQQLEAMAAELVPLWNEYQTASDIAHQASLESTDASRRLRRIPGLRRALAEECGLATEMADPMASSEHRVPRLDVEDGPVPSGPQMAQPADSENQAQSSENAQANNQLAILTIPQAFVVPRLPGATNQPGSSVATPRTAQEQSTSAVTAQIMQVRQPESTSTGSSVIGYTHMTIPQNAGQSGQAVARHNTRRSIPNKVPMRLHLGRSVKR